MPMLLIPSVSWVTAASWTGDGFDQWGLLVALVAFSALWITALGASVGSFLNVVVWRLPQGMGLVRPKSHCPKCGTPILSRDNLPVIGWLCLKGRCRACGAAISARYPLVEASTAMLFLGLAHFELFTGGANLPGGPPRPEGLSAVLWHVRPAIIGVFVYHATLISLLLCVTLIVWDGFRPPRSLALFGIAFALLVSVVLPVAHPVQSGISLGSWPAWIVSTRFGSIPIVPKELLTGVIGLMMGITIGGVLSAGVPIDSRGAADRRGTLIAVSLIGVFLGWQACLACNLAAAILMVLNAIAIRALRIGFPVTGLISVMGIAHVPGWRRLAMSDWVPGLFGWRLLHNISWPQEHFVATSVAAAFVALTLLAAIARLVGAARTASSPGS
jgi:prepilin signal peptidase PulO-like enzyme (type II secretory pathway)